MAESYGPYADDVRAELTDAIESMGKADATSDATSDAPEHPIVETCRHHHGKDVKVQSNEIWHSARECCLVERSRNSVRCSFLFKQHPHEPSSCVQSAKSSPFVNVSTAKTVDPIERAICSKYLRYFQQRAEAYRILRRRPIRGYTVSFLIAPEHVQRFGARQIADIISDFLLMADEEFSDARIMLNARTRFLAAEFMSAF